MLKSLTIKNYALINDLHIDWNPGFTIITGETGAGKSILLGALSLILGQRADTSVLLDKSKKCIVEASFYIKPYNLKSFFEENDLDYEENTIIRREIIDNGKSRAFINDSPVNINQLKSLGILLIDIHSQHENLNLSTHQFQLKVVDSIAQHQTLIEEYTNTYYYYRSLESEFKELSDKANKSKADYDYFQFQYNQLNDAKLVEGEQEELEKELEALTHAEEIKMHLSYSVNNLSGDNNSILNVLREIKNSNEKTSKFLPQLEEFTKRLESAYIDLNDLSREFELLAEKIEYDPKRIQQINERLDLIYSLQQKHRVESVQELIELKKDFENKLNDIGSYEEQLQKIKNEINDVINKIKELAAIISENRKNTIPKIEQKIIYHLQQLGMPHSKFSIQHQLRDEFDINGIDDILFLFSANKNTPILELSKVASGGEISRLMLSLKYLISRNISLPTIIFDEIDSGVSGEIADKMGSIMKEMSTHMQLVNITHLPQVAGKGDFHYLVYKIDENKITSTKIKLLNNEDRIVEIAKMLSGEQLTEAALLNAKELLAN